MIYLFATGTDKEFNNIEKAEFTALIDGTDVELAKTMFGEWLDTTKPSFTTKEIYATKSQEKAKKMFESVTSNVPIGKLANFRANRETFNEWKNYPQEEGDFFHDHII